MTDAEIDRHRMEYADDVIAGLIATVDSVRVENAELRLGIQRAHHFLWAVVMDHGGTFALSDAAVREIPPDAEIEKEYDAANQVTVWRAVSRPAAGPSGPPSVAALSERHRAEREA